MRRHFLLKKKKFLIIGSLVIIIASVFIFNKIRNTDNKNTLPASQTYTIKKGDIKETIKVSGKAELVNEQKLRFNQVGTVAKVYFKSGQTVKSGQLIAELDKTDYLNDMKQAQIALDSARLNLKDLKNGNKQSQIINSQNNVKSTERNIESAKKDLIIQQNKYKKTIDDLNKAITMAQTDYDNKKQILELSKKKLLSVKQQERENINNAGTNFSNNLSNSLAEVNNTFSFVNDFLLEIETVLNPDNKSWNDTVMESSQDNIGALNSDSKFQTKNYYQSVKNSLQILKSQYENIKNQTLTKDNVVILLSKTKEILEITEKLSNTYYQLWINTISGSNLSNNTIDSYRNSASNNIKSIQSKITNINNVITSINNLNSVDINNLNSESNLIQAENATKDAEYNLTKAEQNLTSLQNNLGNDQAAAKLVLTKAEQSLANLQNELLANKEQLKDTLKGATDIDLAKAKNDIIQKELNLEKTRATDEKYQITAPFDGVISQIDYQIGDKITQDDAKYIYIQNPNLLRINISLDQIDIVKVALDQTANIVFDAYPKQTFTGKIDIIDTTPQTTSGVVLYKINITLNKGETKIYSGMTAMIDIIIGDHKDVLLVPNSAVIINKGQSFLRIEGQAKPVSVKTGLIDEKNIEITEGAKEGQKIIISNFSLNNKSRIMGSSSRSSNTNRVGVFGGGMGGSIPH